MPASSDSGTVARAAAVNFLGMLAKSSRALVTIFVTRVSGPATFGLFMLTVAVVELVSRFTVFGMDKSLLKYVPEVRSRSEDEQYPILSTVLFTGLAFGLLTTVGIAIGAPWISELWLKEPTLVGPLRLMAVAVIPLTLLMLLLAATKALTIMKYDAVVTGLLMPLGMLALAVPILWTENDVLTLVGAYVGSTTLGFVAALWFFRRHFSLARSLTSAPGGVAKSILGFSTPLGLHDFVQYLAMKLELFLLAYFVSPLELGIYALASELSFVLKKFRQTFDPVLIPLMSEARALGQRERLEEQLRRVIRWLLLFGVPYVGVMVLFDEPVLGLFGREFVVGGTALLLLCAAQMLNVGTGVLDMAMLASGRPRINLLNVSILLVVQTGLNLWLIPRAGIVGAAAAALGAFAILAVVRIAQSFRLLGVNPFAASQLKPVLAGALAAAPIVIVSRTVAAATSWWPALLVIFLGAYWAGLKASGLDAEDARLIESALGKLRPRRESSR